MNEFFCGRPDLKTKVVSTGANYNVTFNSAGMKFAQYINVKNATLTKPCSLRLLGRETNGGNNVGILFGDVGTKGFPKGMFTKPMTFNGSENGFKTNIN